jgi:triosephosphate isomerase (TIM)
MRDKIVAGNWKMNKSYEEGILLTKEIIEALNYSTSSAKVILFPSFVHLGKISETVIESEKEIFIGAQDCSSKESGACTGEVSASMVKSAGAEYVIIGHSERRQYHNENDELLLEKVKMALATKLVPVFCCGELLADRENENQFQVVKSQLQKGLFNLNPESFSKVIIAYEPVWAIGTGKTATPEQAQQMHKYIRSLVQEQYGNAIAEKVPVLYGGSCNAANAKEIFSKKDVDGGLIGGASLKASDFISIVNSF